MCQELFVIFILYIGGKWVTQLDLETVSVRKSVNSVHNDVYVCVVWYFCCDCLFPDNDGEE